MALKTIALLLIALSGIFYGSLGFLGTIATREGLSVPQMSVWRYTFASLFTLFALIPFWKKHLSGDRSSQKHFLKSFKKGIGDGFIFYSLSSILYFYASIQIGTGLGMILFYVYPLLVALLSWILDREKIQTNTWISLALMMIGLAFIGLSPGQQGHQTSFFSFITGIGIDLCAALFYALYMYRNNSNEKKHLLHAKELEDNQLPNPRVDSMILTLGVCFGCILNSLVFSGLGSPWVWPSTSLLWLDLIALGLLGTALPILLLFEGMRFVSATQASVLSSLEPLITLILGMSFLGEQVSIYQFIGIFFVLGGALLAQDLDFEAIFLRFQAPKT